MNHISNEWKCREIPYSDKLAIFSTRLKYYLDKMDSVLLKDTEIEINIEAGSKANDNRVRFDYLGRTEDFEEEDATHAIATIVLRFEEDYVSRTGGTYNCESTTKRRTGRLRVRVASSGGPNYSVTDNVDGAFLLSGWLQGAATEFSSATFRLFSETLSPSYFKLVDVDKDDYSEED